MKSWIPKETVIFMVPNPSKKEVDENLKPVTVYDDHSVPGCVVYDSSSLRLGEGFDFHDKIRKIIHIPKDFKEDIRGGFAVVNDVKYKITDATDPYTRSPLKQNRHAICEAITNGKR